MVLELRADSCLTICSFVEFSSDQLSDRFARSRLSLRIHWASGLRSAMSDIPDDRLGWRLRSLADTLFTADLIYGGGKADIANSLCHGRL